jgi:Putative transposase DNA-binding domain/Helix-turn-helix domain
VIQAYRFALDPSPAQEAALRSHCGAQRFAFNWGLARVKANLGQREAERSYGMSEELLTPAVNWSAWSLRKDFNVVKHQVAPWWAENSKEAYASGLANLAAALGTGRPAARGPGKGRKWHSRCSRASTQFPACGLPPELSDWRTGTGGTMAEDPGEDRPPACSCRKPAGECPAPADHAAGRRLRHGRGRGPARGRDAAQPAAGPTPRRRRLGQLRRQLSYKTAWHGGRLVLAGRFYPSSKTCSIRGAVKARLRLSERTYWFERCGPVLDWDLNAARNLAALVGGASSPSRGATINELAGTRIRPALRAMGTATGRPSLHTGMASTRAARHGLPDQ